MTAPETPRVARRPFWADVRFLLGIVLIVASILGVWFVVSAGRTTTPVLTAARTLVPGEVIAADDVRTVEVALGTAADAYIAAIDEGAVATRTIRSGELLPRSAVGEAADARTTTVVVRSTVDVPAVVETGSAVEVWAAPQVERGVFDAPRILVPDATVAAVVRDESMMGGGAAAVELVIPRADVAAVLGAISDGSALSVVPGAGR